MTQKSTYTTPLLAWSASVVFAFGCLDLDAEDGSGGAGQGGARTSGGSAGQGLSSGGTLTAGGSSNSRGGSSGGKSTGGRGPELKGGAANQGGEQNGGGGGGDAGASGEGGAEAGSGGRPAGGEGGGPGGEGGAGGGAPVEEPLCSDSSGNPVSSDVFYGVGTEYAFALSMSCEIGGYIAPLVAADPVDLKEVDAFVRDLTAWYRAEILHCAEATSPLTPNSFGLLPSSQSDGLSQADADASVDLFMVVLDRHDTQPDAVDPATKEKIRERLKSKADAAVQNAKDELTKPLAPPDCVPADLPGGSR